MKKRITVYVDEADYATLRSRLILLKKTFTSWLKEAIAKANKE